jgi:hypothetical protein
MGTLDFKEWPHKKWGVVKWGGNSVSDDGATVSFQLTSETEVKVCFEHTGATQIGNGYPAKFKGQGGEAKGEMSVEGWTITSSQLPNTKYQLQCSSGRTFEPASWTAVEQ